MSHVDDGALHAYLDGALDEYPAAEARRVREHLEACDQCRVRLDAEREIRDGATAILGMAAPEVEVPSFEELRAYVQASRPRQPTVSVRVYRLGWAASVLLALGTGWMLRDGQLPSPSPQDTARPVPVLAPAEAEPEAFANDEVGVEPEALERQIGLAGRAELNEVARGAASADVAAPAPAPDLATELRENATFADRAERDRIDANVAPRALADLDAPAAVVAGEPALDRISAGAGAIAPAAQSSPVGGRPTDDGPDRQAARTQEVAQAPVAAPTSPAPDDGVVRRTAEPVVTSAITAGQNRAAGQADRSRESEVDEDQVSLPLVILGLEVLDVVARGDGTVPMGQRALQRLESGDTLELVHLPENVDPSTLPPVGEGRNELVHRGGTGWLVLRAPLSMAGLEELLQRLEGSR